MERRNVMRAIISEPFHQFVRTLESALGHKCVLSRREKLRHEELRRTGGKLDCSVYARNGHSDEKSQGPGGI